MSTISTKVQISTIPSYGKNDLLLTMLRWKKCGEPHTFSFHFLQFYVRVVLKKKMATPHQLYHFQFILLIVFNAKYFINIGMNYSLDSIGRTG